MQQEKSSNFGALGLSDDRYQLQREQLESLCHWIELHLDEPIGWQELMAQSGWTYQTIQTLFYRYKCTTAMTWIRLRRQMRSPEASFAPPPAHPRRAELVRP